MEIAIVALSKSCRIEVRHLQKYFVVYSKDTWTYYKYLNVMCIICAFFDISSLDTGCQLVWAKYSKIGEFGGKDLLQQ